MVSIAFVIVELLGSVFLNTHRCEIVYVFLPAIRDPLRSSTHKSFKRACSF